ncbi:response regulator [Candidatus Kaiserbacteria bacterium]|nr:response regulator [Candidatus Kaiserbacteria bacterium]
MTKVLVAEDDTLLSKILVNTLIKAGFDTHAAMDGFEAEVEAKSWHPDVILLDLLMPNEDGFGVLRTIRSDTETFHTKVVVLSNLSGPEVMDQVKKFGVTEYLVKAQMSPEDVVSKLKSMFPQAAA